jgi:hypothetical protein
MLVQILTERIAGMALTRAGDAVVEVAVDDVIVVALDTAPAVELLRKSSAAD